MPKCDACFIMKTFMPTNEFICSHNALNYKNKKRLCIITLVEIYEFELRRVLKCAVYRPTYIKEKCNFCPKMNRLEVT